MYPIIADPQKNREVIYSAPISGLDNYFATSFFGGHTSQLLGCSLIPRSKFKFLCNMFYLYTKHAKSLRLPYIAKHIDGSERIHSHYA